MKQIRNYLLYLVGATVLICTIGLLVINEDVVYEEMTIKDGEDLYILAEKYRGTLTQHEWLSIVKRENNLYGTYVYTGQSLKIPIHDDVDLIQQQDNPIKLARSEQ